MFKPIKTIIAIAVLATVSIASHAQSRFWDGTKSTEGVSLTGHFGLNVNDIYGTSDWSGIKAGINVGVMAEKPIFNSLSVKAGLFYSMKGNHHKSGIGFAGSDLEVTYNPGYLVIPVLASYRYQATDDVRLQFDFGPYFGIGLHGKDVKKVNGSGPVGDSTTEYDLFGKDGQWSRFDFGFRFGPELLWKNRLSVGLAYELSAVNIWPDSGGKIGNSTFMINLGYRFKTF